MEIEQFKVERWLNVYELDARYNLAETDAKPFGLEELLSLGNKEALTQELMDLKLGYNPTTGSEALRSIIAGKYRGVDPGEVLVTVGAIEADFHIANVLVKPGDTVIVQFPAYQVLYSVAKARGATVKFWNMRMEDGYKPNLEELRSLIDRRTKLVVVNNPHNPTGTVLSQDDMRTILGWAEDEGFWVLSDEVYHGLAFEEGVVAEPARNLSPRAISVGSMSKTFGLSGLRLGWIVGPQEILNACWAWKDYTSISNSPVSDFLARLALRESGRVWQRNLKIARENLEVLEGWVDRMSRFVCYVRPRAGLVCFPRFTLPVSTEEFCLRAYHERGVLLVPGECFDVPGHIRFGIGGDPGTFSQGLDELEAVLSQY